jgi:predicted RNA polymerase sigma factor
VRKPARREWPAVEALNDVLAKYGKRPVVKNPLAAGE